MGPRKRRLAAISRIWAGRLGGMSAIPFCWLQINDDQRLSKNAVALDGARMGTGRAAAYRRGDGSLRVQKTCSATLTLHPLNGDPALVGREIHNHLQQAGIKERNCVFCVPLSWAIAMQTKVPPIPDADLQSFLDIEAERSFPYAPE